MDFVLEVSPAVGGGLGPLRYGMTDAETMTALDQWRELPGPRGTVGRKSGLGISPMVSRNEQLPEGRLEGFMFGGPGDGSDRLIFDGIDLWGGSLVQVVAEIRSHGHAIAEHGPERFVTDDTDVWLWLEHPPQFGPSDPHIVNLVVARPNLLPAWHASDV